MITWTTGYINLDKSVWGKETNVFDNQGSPGCGPGHFKINILAKYSTDLSSCLLSPTSWISIFLF